MNTQGRLNIIAGLIFLALFSAYGFALIWLRDFAPDKAAWIASYADGQHFQARLAHVHGNLFALLNILTGWLLTQFPVSTKAARGISWTALAGMLMPIGIFGEAWLSLPPVLVLIGAVSLVVTLVWLALAISRTGP